MKRSLTRTSVHAYPAHLFLAMEIYANYGGGVRIK